MDAVQQEKSATRQPLMFVATVAKIQLIIIMVVSGIMIEAKNGVALTKSTAIKAAIKLEQKIHIAEMTRLKKKELVRDAVREDLKKNVNDVMK